MDAPYHIVYPRLLRASVLTAWGLELAHTRIDTMKALVNLATLKVTASNGVPPNPESSI